MIFFVSGTLDKAEKILQETFIGLNIWERQYRGMGSEQP
jgi:hypothetical protein